MNNLAKYRAKANLTQKQLADQIGLNDASISLSEKKKLTLPIAKKAASVLNVNVFTLLGTDCLKIVPTTEEDKEALIEIIKGL